MKYILVLLLVWAAPAPRKAAWTILFYSDADCDLEAPMLQDIVEAAQAKPSDRVNLVVMCDRAKEDEKQGYSGDEFGALGNFSEARRFVLSGGDATEVEELGEVDMCSAKTLAGYLAWGVKAHPADRYALVLSDHGSGWPGFGHDDDNKGEILSLKALDEALKSGLKEAGIERLDLIGWDCCLMGALEPMKVCAPYAKVMVASEELEPGYGWEYTTWVNAVVEKPDRGPEAIAPVICDSFRDFYAKHEAAEVKAQGENVTLSAVHTEKVAAVVEAADAMAEAVTAYIKEKGREGWVAVAKARHGAEAYGPGGMQQDLHHLARNLKGLGFDKACDGVTAAIEAAVFHRIGGPLHPEGRGIAIYWPAETSAHDEAAKSYDYHPVSDAWGAMVEAYLAAEAGDTDDPDIANCASTDAELDADDAASVTASFEAGDVAEMNFVLAHTDGEEQIILGMYPVETDGHDLKAEFDGAWLALSSGEHHQLAPITHYEEVSDADDVYVVGVPAVYDPPETEEAIVVMLYFKLDLTGDESEAEFVGAFEEETGGSRAVEIETGGTLRPIYAFVKDDEVELKTSDEEPMEIGESLDLTPVEVPDGDYLVGFVLTDYAGNSAEALTAVAVNQE